MADISRLLQETAEGRDLDQEDVALLIGLSDKARAGQLHAMARRVRQQSFGNSVFLYGFLYFSTFCRNNCLFCGYRKDNEALARYRKSTQEVVQGAQYLARAGVHLIDLTMGEDPFFYGPQARGRGRLLELVSQVKANTGLPIMVSPGVVSPDFLTELMNAGADWYACYQETYNRRLFQRLRPGQSFDQRIARKKLAKQKGLLIEEGIMCGVGESVDDLAGSLLEMRALDADQVRAMSFIPQAGTTMAGRPSPSRLLELNTIAVMRIMFPERLIPASLDVDGVVGLQERLEAGANVVTSLVPPRAGMAGVANAQGDIKNSARTPQGIAPVLAACGLEVARQEAYLHWMEKRRPNPRLSVTPQKQAC